MKLFLILCLIFFLPNSALSFYEFQNFIEKKSKKQTNCAYCHSHPNGPEGNESGQLGSLTPEEKELTAYNQYLKGEKLQSDSPILNDFGNYLVKKLTYENILKAQENPNILVKRLKKSDFDKDGITDSEELLEGTLPNDKLDGNPLKLFASNFRKNCIEICFQIIVSIALILSMIKLKSLL